MWKSLLRYCYHPEDTAASWHARNAPGNLPWDFTGFGSLTPINNVEKSNLTKGFNVVLMSESIYSRKGVFMSRRQWFVSHGIKWEEARFSEKKFLSEVTSSKKSHCFTFQWGRPSQDLLEKAFEIAVAKDDSIRQARKNKPCNWSCSVVEEGGWLFKNADFLVSFIT